MLASVELTISATNAESGPAAGGAGGVVMIDGTEVDDVLEVVEEDEVVDDELLTVTA